MTGIFDFELENGTKVRVDNAAGAVCEFSLLCETGRTGFFKYSYDADKEERLEITEGNYDRLQAVIEWGRRIGITDPAFFNR